MKRSRFQERVKMISGDLNALHEFTEGALSELIEAMSGGLDTLLFDDQPSSYVVNPGVDVTISIPAQRFAAGGVVGSITAASSVQPYPPGDVQYNIFFVVGRTNVSDSRDRLDLGPPLAQIVDNVVIRDEPVSRHEVTTNAMPSMGLTDIDYVLLGSVQKLAGIWSATHNTAALYTFPGFNPLAAPHGASHVTTDPVPEATMAGEKGLMPTGSFQFLKGALQSLSIAPGSECLVRVQSGDNTPGNPRKAQLTFRSSESFRIIDVSGSPGLGLNFAAGPYKGTSSVPARGDHRHSPEESPVAVLAAVMPVGPSDRGLLLPAITFSGIARILQTQVFWSKPGVGSPDHPIVPCGWMLSPLSPYGSIGAQAVITGNNKVNVQAGERAFAYLTSAVIALVDGGGGVTWQYDGGHGYPTDGVLFVRVVGLR